jgi:hypothetical protein
LGEATSDQAVVTHTFSKPGFYRVGVTVTNGTFAGLSGIDLLVVDDDAEEIGTEFAADQWGAEVSGIGSEAVRFTNDTDAMVGKYSLRFEPESYGSEMITVTYPKTEDAGWNLSAKEKLVFWMKMLNPNIPIEEGENGRAAINLHGKSGDIRFVAKNYSAFFHGTYSEARSNWRRVEIPLSGESGEWIREKVGDASLDEVNAISFSIFSAGDMPFTVWIDGLSFE